MERGRFAKRRGCLHQSGLSPRLPRLVPPCLTLLVASLLDCVHASEYKDWQSTSADAWTISLCKLALADIRASFLFPNCPPQTGSAGLQGKLKFLTSRLQAAGRQARTCVSVALRCENSSWKTKPLLKNNAKMFVHFLSKAFCSAYVAGPGNGKCRNPSGIWNHRHLLVREMQRMRNGVTPMNNPTRGFPWGNPQTVHSPTPGRSFHVIPCLLPFAKKKKRSKGAASSTGQLAFPHLQILTKQSLTFDKHLYQKSGPKRQKKPKVQSLELGRAWRAVMWNWGRISEAHQKQHETCTGVS